MRYTSLMILIAVATLLTACAPQPEASKATGAGIRPAAHTPIPKPPHVTPFGGESAVASATGGSVYMVHLQIGTIEVPTGVASGSEELWSYLDEEPLSRKSTLLGLNGIRVGLGRQETWPDLERVLKKMTGQKYQSYTLQTFTGKPAAITLRKNMPIQTIFTYFNDQTLSGEDYPPGDNRLLMSCSLNEDDPTKLLLTAMPQIQSSKTVATVIYERGTPKIVTQPAQFNFRPLTFQVNVPHNDFLIVGPGIQSRRPTSVANHFLVQKKNGMDYETVLILRPKIFRVELDKPRNPIPVNTTTHPAGASPAR